MITDGPHGLRKSLASSTGETDLDNSVPATCFPPAAGLSSFLEPGTHPQGRRGDGRGVHPGEGGRDPGPQHQHQAQPARRPLLRIFVRDPYLAGHEAVGIVAGVQSKGVGTSLKHFAANRRPTVCASMPASASAPCARSTCRPSNTSSRPPSRGPSCAPTTVSTACTPPRITGC